MGNPQLQLVQRLPSLTGGQPRLVHKVETWLVQVRGRGGETRGSFWGLDGLIHVLCVCVYDHVGAVGKWVGGEGWVNNYRVSGVGVGAGEGEEKRHGTGMDL